jgi:hypothetical protein
LGDLDPNTILTPTGNVTLPTASQLLSGVNCGVNGTSIAGTFVAPTASQLVHGQSCGVSGGIAGTQYVPAAADVRSGASTGTTAGTCAVPTASQVLSGVSVDATTGNVTLPSAGSLLVGVQCGVNGTSVTGTVDLRIDTPTGKALAVTLYQTQGGTAWNSNVSLSFGSNTTAGNYVAFAGSTLNLIGSAYPSDLQVANSSLTTVTIASGLSVSGAGWVSPLTLSGCALAAASELVILSAAVAKMQFYHASCQINISGGTNAAMMYPGNLTVTAGTGANAPDQNNAGTYHYTSSNQAWITANGTISPVFKIGS